MEFFVASPDGLPAGFAVVFSPEEAVWFRQFAEEVADRQLLLCEFWFHQQQRPSAIDREPDVGPSSPVGGEKLLSFAARISQSQPVWTT